MDTAGKTRVTTDAETEDIDDFVPRVLQLVPNTGRSLPMTDAELAEYRELLPTLQRMVREWQRISAMCPMARRLTEGME